jgi:hypothetical protein
MTALNLFGLLAVSVMVACYALEGRHTVFVLAFAFSCVLASVYGFLQGAWPFGLLEGVWSIIAARRWWIAARAHATTSWAK